MVRVSVLMGIYNCEEYLQQALDSLYAQTYRDFKIILCDDGSADNTYEIATQNAAAHSNIVLIRNQRNMGLNHTLNRCLELADTEYCARMDGDDISLPTRFEEEVKFLDEHPEYAIVSTPMIYFDEEGDFRVGKGRGEVHKMDFIHGSPICHAPCMIRTEVLKQVGGYAVDPRLLRVEDYDLWFRLYEVGYKAYNMEQPLYKMRDNRNAKARRGWIPRRNEMYVMRQGFKRLSLPWYTWFCSFRPLIAYLAPSWLYDLYHKR